MVENFVIGLVEAIGEWREYAVECSDGWAIRLKHAQHLGHSLKDEPLGRLGDNVAGFVMDETTGSRNRHGHRACGETERPDCCRTEPLIEAMVLDGPWQAFVDHESDLGRKVQETKMFRLHGVEFECLSVALRTTATVNIRGSKQLCLCTQPSSLPATGEREGESPGSTLFLYRLIGFRVFVSHVEVDMT
jgi:hypothetical protein